MMQKIQFLLLFCVVLMLTNCKKSETNILYQKQYINEIKKLRKEVSFFMGRSFIPGASVAVIKNNELIYSEGFGWASKDLEVKVKRDTKFRIGAVSELYTNLIYQKMVEEGLLHPDSSVQHYLPDFPDHNVPIHLQHLVNHTSGIRPMKTSESEWRGLNVSLQKAISNFQDDELMSKPGAYQQESRFNYNLLGAVMEKASGKNFLELLQTYVTDTLQLNNTCTDNPFGVIKKRTDFFDRNFIAQIINAQSMDMRWRLPSDGLLSNAEDLAKLGNVFLKSDYLNAETREKLFEPVILPGNIPSRMANGWMLFTDQQGAMIYGREGSVVGGSSALAIFPKEELVVAVVTNLTDAASDTPIFKFAGFFVPQPESAAEEPTKE